MAAISTEEIDFDNGEDHIHKLSDDILSTFLSFMGMKDAAKTSILSKRWRYLWTSQTHLDFNHSIIFPESDPNPLGILFFEPRFLDLKSKYINWVNTVVDLHCNPCIDTFRVWFYFESGDADEINKWFRFALSKKVETLELNLISWLPRQIFCLDILNDLKPSLGIGDNGFTCLKSLYLNSVMVSGDFLEWLLSRSLLLERLYVGDSNTLVRLKVVGLSCKLKHLTIRYCSNLQELKVDAMNLVYFECLCKSECPIVEFKSAPVLSEAAFGGNIIFLGSIFHQISHLAAQISKLHLNLKGYGIPTCVLPTFRNLKQLSLIIDNYSVPFDLAALTNLLATCLLLKELKLEVHWTKQETTFELESDELKAEDVLHWYLYDTHMEQKTHPNLKVLQVIAFRGCQFDVDVILFLVGLACNLETIICDSSYEFPKKEIIEVSRDRASRLTRFIPPRINVVII